MWPFTGRGWRGWNNPAGYRWFFVALAALSTAEVALRVLLPWPMQIVVDNALGNVSPAAWIVAIAGKSRAGWLVFAVAAGILVQATHQAILMLHTRHSRRST